MLGNMRNGATRMKMFVRKARILFDCYIIWSNARGLGAASCELVYRARYESRDDPRAKDKECPNNDVKEIRLCRLELLLIPLGRHKVKAGDDEKERHNRERDDSERLQGSRDKCGDGAELRIQGIVELCRGDRGKRKKERHPDHERSKKVPNARRGERGPRGVLDNTTSGTQRGRSENAEL